MVGQISRGWSLMKQSWAVLRLDKELMLFPVLSSIACLFVLASFALPIVMVPDLRSQVFELTKQEDGGFRSSMHVPALLLAAFYVVNYFVIVFFNTALVSCAVIRFGGGDPTVGDGLRAALARLPQILAWTLVAATVGLILQMIEQRLKFVGRIVVGLIGTAWSVVTYLVVPTLAVERVGPFRAIRRSGELLRRIWGEALVGNIGLGAVTFILALPAILVIVGAGMVGGITQSLWLALVPAALGVTYLVMLSIVTSTMRQIFLAGVYLYAAQGQVPAGFSEGDLRSAFRVKS